MTDEFADAFARAVDRLPPVRWPAPDEIRRGARILRRRRAALVLATAVAVAVAAIPAGVSLRDGASGPGPGPGGAGTATPPLCASGLIPARMDMPDESGIVLRVFDATGGGGAAEAGTAELRRRGFVVASALPYDTTFAGVALIRYGPNAVGPAWVVQAYFLDGADLVFQLHNPEPEVDVILGRAFSSLATVTEVNQSIAANGQPPLPEGTCAAG
jgi:hypothetical protein